ncbi:DMT family transporter [Paremcibacter congregatus]|uniref:EamA family transporter n=1 Tax=Paremcibacter congregatus TaxID=2043170 RepID=A0A2G4YVY9_9PROT|nr:DMT family transporter [Paremcibacter congregatus]PHZ86410.1 EamA family transporter [Paremcibacter congregatus]QDE28495.1 DMT family transporter [Paremcibacter congregatus]
MRRHMTQKNHDTAFAKGLILILISVLFWGILPLALKFSLQKLDGVTITWFRFLVALGVCAVIQYFNGALAQFRTLTRRDWTLLTAAALFLIIDYVGYISSLNYISPSASIVFTQVTPFFLTIGGVIVFKERMSALQVLCFVLLFAGLVLFFHDSLISALTTEAMLWQGVFLTVGAALFWTFYAMLQKKLSQKLSPSNILLFTYGLAIVVLFPASDTSGFAALTPLDWSLLTFCAFNTIIAYGAFAEALHYWDASQVGSVLATTPLFTIAATFTASLIWPGLYTADQVSLGGWIGIALVIFSVAGFNIVKHRRTKALQALAATPC